MKTIKNICYLLTIALIFSCSNEIDNTDNNPLEIKNISNFDLDSALDLVTSNSSYDDLKMAASTINNHIDSKNSIIQKDKLTSGNFFPVRVSINTVESENLNYLLPSISPNDEIFGITTFISKESKIKGLLLYIYSESEKVMKASAYQNDTNGQLNLLKDFPIIVNDMLLNDIIAVGNNHFPTLDMFSATTSNYDKYDLKHHYNDLYLKNVTNNIYNTTLKTDVTEKDSKSNSFYNSKDDELVRNQYLEVAGICSMAVHTCQTGSGPRCTAYGCREACGAQMVRQEIRLNDDLIVKDDKLDIDLSPNFIGKSNNKSTAIEMFNNSLPESSMYALKDKLMATPKGYQYTSMYYAIGGHFKSTLEISNLVDIINLAPDINKAISNLTNTSQEKVVINEELYGKIESLLLKSKDKSISNVYKNSINLLLDDLKGYKGLTSSQVFSKLNTF